MTYIAEKEFEHQDFSTSPLEVGEYEACSFFNCNFQDANLSGYQFTDCIFHDCNLSNSQLNNTYMQTVKFEKCKLLGLPFEYCNPFGFSVEFDTCILNQSSFYQRNISSTVFTNCELKDVDFSEADLSRVSFNNCDLSAALFDRSTLEKTDFRTSVNYTIDLDQNRIKGAKFSVEGLPGLLNKYNILIEK